MELNLINKMNALFALKINYFIFSFIIKMDCKQYNLAYTVTVRIVYKFSYFYRFENDKGEKILILYYYQLKFKIICHKVDRLN